MADQSNIQSAASKSIRPFKSSEEYLYAMKEDLAEWLNTLYDLDVTVDTFMERLETGCALCRHANHVNRAADDFQRERPEAAQAMKVPGKDVVFQARNVAGGSFLARDNVSNFIGWCRQELWIKDVLMFETNDLVERCNEKNFVLCLLEVARRGAKFGMLAPLLIQLEEEIEEEIRDQENLVERDPGGEPGEESPPSRCRSRKEVVESVDEYYEPEPVPFWQQKRVLCDMRNLDELVREILGRCSCPAQFPMTKVSEGKYKVGDSSALIFIRVLRTHVMVRVGGGWDTLEHYLDKHDPCRCAGFAHRYHQAKASGGQGGHSKSSSAHSSRSTSPGPHWRNEGIAPYKPPDRRSLEPPCAPCAPHPSPSSSSSTRPPCAPHPSPSSSSSTRPGRSHHPSLPAEPDANAGRTLLPRPPRDRSEPRHFNPLRSLPVTRRLSGDSDSSTASSKGGGPGGGGPRFSLGGGGGCGTPRRSGGEEVVLLVNRKEGRHVIERPAGGAQINALRPPLSRARSHSRERPAPPAAPSLLKPTPPQADAASRAARTERGRSIGHCEGPRRFQAPRSHSQGKLPPPSPRFREPQPPPQDLRVKQGLPPPTASTASSSSPRIGGGFGRRQSSSCSNSPVKGVLGGGGGGKKTPVAPRPPAPRSPSVGGKSRLLPPVASSSSGGGRRSPHASSSPRNSHHHGPRSPRAPHGAPRPAGRGLHSRSWSGLDRLEPGEEEEEEEEEGERERGRGGLGFSFQMLPSLDAQKEQDLYRSFEAEFLANTQQNRGPGGPQGPGGGGLQLPASSPHSPHSPLSPQGAGALAVPVPVPAGPDPNVTDSAYSSSNSSTSSLNVGGKAGALPDLRESKRTSAQRGYPLEDPLGLAHGHGPGGLLNGGHGEPAERWGDRGGGLRKLPAISGSMEERELLSSAVDGEAATLASQPPTRSPFHARSANGSHGGCPPAGAPMSRVKGERGWGLEPEGDVPREDDQPNLPYDLQDGDVDDDLPPPEACPSPVALPPSEDCSFQEDSSSETSSMCFSLSESRSESSPPPPPSSSGVPLANGDADSGVVLRPKRGGKKAERVPSIYKLKLRPRIRPRHDNRPENSPSRIPTPVGYRDLQDALSPRGGGGTPPPPTPPPMSPQSGHSNGHPAARKGLHQAFTDLIQPQPRVAALGAKDCSFPGGSGGLDTEAWM